MKLRIKRLVQIVHVMQRSQEAKDTVRRAEIEWQTKTLAAFLSSLASSKELADAMHDEVGKLSMTPRPPDQADTGSADTSGGTDSRTLEEIMEHGNVEAALARNLARKGPGLEFLRLNN